MIFPQNQMLAICIAAAFASIASIGHSKLGRVTLSECNFRGQGCGEVIAKTSEHGYFFTFSVEKGDSIAFNRKCRYITNTRSTSGKLSYKKQNKYEGDRISLGTSHLFTLFHLKSALLPDSSGKGNYFRGSRKSNAQMLQKAIWALEDEISLRDASGLKGNAYLRLVANAYRNKSETLKTGYERAKSDYSPIASQVRVLNITTNRGEPLLDQLVFVKAPKIDPPPVFLAANAGVTGTMDPVQLPDTGSTFLILGLSVSAIIGTQRYINARAQSAS